MNILELVRAKLTEVQFLTFCLRWKKIRSVLQLYFPKSWVNRQHFHHACMPCMIDFSIPPSNPHYVTIEFSKFCSWAFILHFHRNNILLCFDIINEISNFLVVLSQNELFLVDLKVWFCTIMINWTGMESDFFKNHIIWYPRRLYAHIIENTRRKNSSCNLSCIFPQTFNLMCYVLH